MTFPAEYRIIKIPKLCEGNDKRRAQNIEMGDMNMPFKIKESTDPMYPYHVRDVHISDPCILADPVSQKYYTYVHFADQERFPELAVPGSHFFVLESKDLINWSRPMICFTKDDDFWADLDYWAPEGHYYNGKYYIISSFRAKGKYRRCQCLVADSPKGPFKPVAPDPVTPEGWHCLDGTLYIDKKNKPWMVFCHEWLQVLNGQIAAVPLSDDLGTAIGDPIILCRAFDAPWAGSDAKPSWVTDGPWMHRLKSGKLIMLWSNFTPQGGYTIGYARSLRGDVQGPWVQEKFPLYMMDGGHGMLFRTFGGQLMMSLHCPNDHPKKRIFLFEMEETDDGIHIVNEVTGNWYSMARGIAGNWNYKDTPCIEDPCFALDPVAPCWRKEEQKSE